VEEQISDAAALRPALRADELERIIRWLASVLDGSRARWSLPGDKT